MITLLVILVIVCLIVLVWVELLNLFNLGIPPKDSDILEQGPIQKISKKKQLAAYKHLGFWKAMDTLNDKNYLEDLWSKSKCPWKIW